MEFDVESFMSDVTAALAHRSPEWRAGQIQGAEEIPHVEPLGGEPFSAYEELLQYPSDQNADTLPIAQSLRHDGLQSGESVMSNEDDDDDDFEHRYQSEGSTPALFGLDMDMSTAIIASRTRLQISPSPGFVRLEQGVTLDTGLMSGERLDLVPSFYTYAIKACLLPIRKVQHELVTLYFQYIHPMFPVVDESYFMNIHRKYRGQEQFMDPSDFVIYQAITAAGFGHLSELQLQRTPYRSVHEGQEAQFDQVKARYWSQPTDDPVVLTQICLIISLWSPGPAGVQNNSYWINLAFKHANTDELWKAKPIANGRPCRRRLLWWCCLVRDRILALGMRRPYRLHRGPFDEYLISHLDFGLEPTSYSAVEIQSKQMEVLAFIWLCKLTEIMAAIALFQQRTKFSREWNGVNIGNSTSELEEVTAFDRDIKRWQDEFEADVLEKTRDQSVHNEKDIPIPVSILRIVCNSLVAVLYQPYLHLSSLDHPPLANDAIDPLQRMKEGSQAVESSVIGLISNKKTDCLPNWLVSWVTLPVAVYYVNQHVKLNPSPDRVLMPFLNRFMRRTTGAQFLFLALTKAMKEFLQRLNKSNQAANGTVFGRMLAPSTNRLDHVNLEWNARGSVVEAKVLAYVTKALDSTLELGC